MQQTSLYKYNLFFMSFDEIIFHDFLIIVEENPDEIPSLTLYYNVPNTFSIHLYTALLLIYLPNYMANYLIRICKNVSSLRNVTIFHHMRSNLVVEL